MTRIHIEFQRVQTWLFAVPRLRAMVGANVLIGEMLRLHLPTLAKREFSQWKPLRSNANYSRLNEDDPLKIHDDPYDDASNGIISRDGGHFEFVVENSDQAQKFASEATELLSSRLPGLRFKVSIDDTEQDKALALISNELPVFTRCEWTGNSLASVAIQQGEEDSLVSLDVANRHEAAKSAEEGKAQDIATLLLKQLDLGGKKRPQDFQELVGPEYLAIIHADGNGVGDFVKGLKDDDPGRANIFHANRVLMRRAIAHAVKIACADTVPLPLIPLMIGGDDLLVVCRASKALPFVKDLCEELARIQDGVVSPLTLGVGVVIARPSVPIHRLHAIAEQMVSSAKRRCRGQEPSKRSSVVDWSIFTTTWLDDPEIVRQRDWLRTGGTRVLSQRPIPVLGDELTSLKGLLQAAKAIENAPRSQLRYLVEQLARGQMLAELAYEELSPEAKIKLREVGINKVWHTSDGKFITHLLDLIEIAEIHRLGKAGSSMRRSNKKEENDGAER